MVSNISVLVFACALLVNTIFFLWWRRTSRKRSLLSRLVIYLILFLSCWIIPVMCLRFVDPGDRVAQYLLDCLMQPGGALCSPVYVCIAITFVQGYEKMPRWMYLLFVIPVLTIVISLTNPLHHLYYVNFSVVRSEIVFGPYMLVSGGCNYVYLISGIVLVTVFALKNRSALYTTQCILFAVSGLCPLVVSFCATFLGIDIPITATPMSFLVTALLNGYAVFRYHMLDIMPVATKHILEALSDGYLVLSEDGLVQSFNRRFRLLFANEYGIVENKLLRNCVGKEDITLSTPVYNMMTAMESSLQGGTKISYEQAVTTTVDGKTKKLYFVVDVSPLELNGNPAGFVLLFKDITQLRESMQRLQENQERMMEQERMAFLGQMIGGLAHNLKTPIMSISGCISAAEELVTECENSLGDPRVEEADYREIFTEMRDWFQKVKDSSAYMSDIIVAIKGQATNIGNDDASTFTIDEMLKRCTLLMRHELQNSGCRLQVEYGADKSTYLRGDINNLIQVVNNLLSNAIYAQQQVGGGEIGIRIDREDDNLHISIMDRGQGVSPNVRDKLFKAMVTSKGTMGTGLGLYISNVVIKGKFNGKMWMKDREGGGSIFGITIPLQENQMRRMSGYGEGNQP